MSLPRLQISIVNNLKDYGKLSESQVQVILATDEEFAEEEMDNLLKTKYAVSDHSLLLAKAKAFGLSVFNGRNFSVDEHNFEKLEVDFCRKNKVLPVGQVADYLIVATTTYNPQLSNKIEEAAGVRIYLLLGSDESISELLETDKEGGAFGEVVEALGVEFGAEDVEIDESAVEDEESAPIIQLANRIIEDAYYAGGSDIHIEPFEKKCRVRVRVDGVCQTKLNVPIKVAGALLARIKVMSNLDIAEKRLPQDGRIVFSQFTKKPMNIDLRVSTAPLNHGEGAVMRILDKSKSTLPLPALGFEPENLELYRKLIRQPYGMVLHCGPTGSGKSMTLYSALNEINSPEVCIRTAEDPIEYTLEGLCQMQMKRQIGLTFASALRAFLRQDPDVILVGEIRDSETAGIAIEAALTGHMLFSTLHTNDAPGTVARLGEMGVEPFMISACLVCVCAQRLMRRVCKSCKQPYGPEGREAEILAKAIDWNGEIFKANPEGCPACEGKGYKGRVGIHELMPNSEALAKAINDEAETAIIKKIAMMNGMRTLHQDSMRKVKAGLSTMAEAIATVPPDMEDLEALAEEFALEEELKNREKLERQKKLNKLKQKKEVDSKVEEAESGENPPLSEENLKSQDSDEGSSEGDSGSGQV